MMLHNLSKDFKINKWCQLLTIEQLKFSVSRKWSLIALCGSSKSHCNGCVEELCQLLVLAAFHFASWLILYILCIFINFIYWSIVVYINFCCTAKWLLYIYIYTFFTLFSSMVYYSILNMVLCCTVGPSCTVHFKYF